MTLVVQERSRAVATVAAPPLALPSRILHPIRYRHALREHWRDYIRRERMADHLYACLVGSRPDLVHSSSTLLGAHVDHSPRVLAVDDGPPVTFLVQMLPGQVIAQYEQATDVIAECMGAAHVRMTREAGAVLRIELLTEDPLSVPLEEMPVLLASPDGPVLLGVDITGTHYRISPVALGHTIIQGRTRSGKSAFCYWLLSQLASAPDLIIAGSDPTGLLLRPFAGTIHEPWQVTGLADVDAHVDLLRRLVAEMDRRIAKIPPREDHITPDEQNPLMVIVFEEYAGLLEAADDGTSSRKSARVAEIHRHTRRLLAESHKAAMRVLMLLQRAETTVLPGFQRGQCAVRISFGVDNADSVVMLHPFGRNEAERHATCPPGEALLSAPGLKLARIRAPYLGDPLYPTYVDLIEARAERLPD